MNRESLSKERTIGEGGCGIVEAVWHPDFAGPVARKRLNDWARRGPERERNIARFKTEVRLLRDRLDHPNVIKVLHADLDTDDPWFLMPLAPKSLADIVPSTGLPDEQVHDLFDQILAAMEHAHGRGVLHRDLKPHNVLLIGGRPVVADFGLGRDVKGHLTRITTTTYTGGTAGYTAPEQLGGLSAADHRSDIFALGSMLYLMVTGRSPEYFDDGLAPPQYRRIVRRCREYDPDRRYQSVAELRADFERLWVDEVDEAPRTQRAKALLPDAATSDQARGELVALYLRHQTDRELFSATLPDWPESLIAAQAAAGPRELGEIISAFCDLLPGELPFAYLDTAAGFLRRVFRASNDPLLRELILRRLLAMAVDNNRYAVGREFVGLIRGAQSPHDRMVARDVLSAEPEAVRWLTAHAAGASDVPLIKEILQTLDAEAPEPNPELPPARMPPSGADWEAMEDRNDRDDPARDLYQHLRLQKGRD